MIPKICACETPSYLRGSILCDSCDGLVIDPEVAENISRAADNAAAALHPNKQPESVPIDVLADGGYRTVDRSTLLSAGGVFTSILPAGSDILFWLLTAIGSGAVGWATKTVIDKILRWRKNEAEIQEVCLAVFGKYFGLKQTKPLSDLAHKSSLARILNTVIEKHTAAGALTPEIEAIAGSGEDLLSELADDHPTSTLLRATILLVRSKILATFGDFSGAYLDLRGVWDCKPCTDTLEKHLGELGCLVLLRQILNHSYLLSADYLGHLDWETYAYSTWIREAEDRMGIDLGDDLPPSELDYWSKFGEIGPGLGLHLGNAALHKGIDADNMDRARRAIQNRFALAAAWDDKNQSPTSWNQFNQIAGQALIIEDESLAVDVLGHAAARAGDSDYPPKSKLLIAANPEAEKMDPYAVEWLLHLALRDQAAGLIRPDMPEGEGSLADIDKRLKHMSRPPRFRRVSEALCCRVYPERTGVAKPDGIFPEMGYGTDIFFPRTPRQFPVGM